MAKNRGKVIKRRPEGLLCNSLKETYLHDDTLRPAQIVYLKAFSLRQLCGIFSVKQRLHALLPLT